MKKIRQNAGIILLFWGLVLISSSASAGGLYIQEFATPSSGTAGAGAEAWAHDASTACHNPAGMTRIKGNELMVGAGISSTRVEFEPDPATPESGGDGENAGSVMPTGGFYYVHSRSKNFKLGLSSYAQAAAMVDYETTWTGRYQCQETSLIVTCLDASVGYRINDWLSIGGGPSLIYSRFELEAAVPRGPFPDGRASIDGDELDWSFNLGAMIELDKTTRIGMVYLHGADINYSGDLKFSPSNISVAADTNIVYPQSVRAGVYHQLNDLFALVASVGWENWSRFENVNISTGVGTTPVPKNWDDVWHFAAGIHYRISDPWLVQLGISYDTSVVDACDRTADMAVDRQIRYAVGALYQWSQTLSIGGQFKFIDLGNARIDSDTLVGEYDKNHALVGSLSFNWKW